MQALTFLSRWAHSLRRLSPSNETGQLCDQKELAQFAPASHPHSLLANLITFRCLHPSPPVHSHSMGNRVPGLKTSWAHGSEGY